MNDHAGPERLSLRRRGLSVESRSVPGTGIVVTVEGDLDNEASPDFGSAVSALLGSAGPAGGLVIDLRGLRYISSSGAGALASIFIAARNAGLSCRLESVPSGAKAVLETLGLWSWLVPTGAFESGGAAEP